MLDHQLIHRHFKSSDPILATVVQQIGPVTLKPQRDRFKTLVRSIISQQISTAAARTIRERLETHVGAKNLRPEVIVKLPVDELRSLGLSGQKAGYILDLATKCADGTIRLSKLGRMADEDVIEELIQIRGIGRWSAQMFLIFSLGRLDVFPPDDLGVRAAIRQLYGFEKLPDKTECLVIGERWRPYASIGSWYCWRYIERQRMQPARSERCRP